MKPLSWQVVIRSTGPAILCAGLEVGVNLRLIQECLGYTSAETTSLYTHLTSVSISTTSAMSDRWKKIAVPVGLLSPVFAFIVRMIEAVP